MPWQLDDPNLSSSHKASELLRTEVDALPRAVELTSRAPVIAGVVVSLRGHVTLT